MSRGGLVLPSFCVATLPSWSFIQILTMANCVQLLRSDNFGLAWAIHVCELRYPHQGVYRKHPMAVKFYRRRCFWIYHRFGWLMVLKRNTLLDQGRLGDVQVKDFQDKHFVAQNWCIYMCAELLCVSRNCCKSKSCTRESGFPYIPFHCKNSKQILYCTLIKKKSLHQCRVIHYIEGCVTHLFFRGVPNKCFEKHSVLRDTGMKIKVV